MDGVPAFQPAAAHNAVALPARPIATGNYLNRAASAAKVALTHKITTTLIGGLIGYGLTRKSPLLLFVGVALLSASTSTILASSFNGRRARFEQFPLILATINIGVGMMYGVALGAVVTGIQQGKSGSMVGMDF